VCVDSGYCETFNRANVELADLTSTPIEHVTLAGIRTAEGEFELDAIVLATGFDGLTGVLLAIHIRGRFGEALRDSWAKGPRTHLGLATAGFPNMFIIAGPGSPFVLTNVAMQIEQHVDWLIELLRHAAERGTDRIDATTDVQAQRTQHVSDVAAGTLPMSGRSWWLGANIRGKPQVFMPYAGGSGNRRAKCEAVAANGYEGFELGPTRKPSLAQRGPVGDTASGH
jgi:cation diffusion facilitator CzcD-associated flavoprotein CzcO